MRFSFDSQEVLPFGPCSLYFIQNHSYLNCLEVVISIKSADAPLYRSEKGEKKLEIFFYLHERAM
jgi:hypothetical protein